MEFDIKQLIKKFAEKWYIIFIVVTLCVAAALLITSFITPKYSSTVTFYVVNIPEDSSYTQSSLIAANESLAKNYIELITSNLVLDGSVEKLRMEYGINSSYKQLQKMLMTSQKSGTGVFSINISNENKAEALIIVKVISEEAVVKISEIEKREDCVRVIRSGQEATSPDSPNLLINVIFALIAGFSISFVLILIIMYTNNKVKTDNDLKNRYEYPVIGQIPRWNSEEKN